MSSEIVCLIECWIKYVLCTYRMTYIKYKHAQSGRLAQIRNAIIIVNVVHCVGLMLYINRSNLRFEREERKINRPTQYQINVHCSYQLIDETTN